MMSSSRQWNEPSSTEQKTARRLSSPSGSELGRGKRQNAIWSKFPIAAVHLKIEGLHISVASTNVIVSEDSMHIAAPLHPERRYSSPGKTLEVGLLAGSQSSASEG